MAPAHHADPFGSEQKRERRAAHTPECLPGVGSERRGERTTVCLPLLSKTDFTPFCISFLVLHPQEDDVYGCMCACL